MNSIAQIVGIALIILLMSIAISFNSMNFCKKANKFLGTTTNYNPIWSYTGLQKWCYVTSIIIALAIW